MWENVFFVVDDGLYLAREVENGEMDGLMERGYRWSEGGDGMRRKPWDLISCLALW